MQAKTEATTDTKVILIIVLTKMQPPSTGILGMSQRNNRVVESYMEGAALKYIQSHRQ